MLIVEGPDGAGKTTLIEKLESALGVTREPRAVSSDAVPLMSMGEYALKELNRGFGMRIYDRFNLISSPFYAMLDNPTFREELLDPEWLREAWQQFRRVGPIIIVCLPPLEVVRRNALHDGTSRVTWDHIDLIWKLYHNFAAQYPFISSVWDYTQNEFSDLDHLVWQLKQRTQRAERMKSAVVAERYLA